jgi:hypothetical protein
MAVQLRLTELMSRSHVRPRVYMTFALFLNAYTATSGVLG